MKKRVIRIQLNVPATIEGKQVYKLTITQDVSLTVWAQFSVDDGLVTIAGSDEYPNRVVYVPLNHQANADIVEEDVPDATP